ncbi:fasciclin domain-containing protein [Hymenobacter sp.]|uniref:fasciclin domain-containing protein n=1 Tax=Hymenobacter sp. TaxID=1898978 RepID=UPI00286AB630|nr:fasciclin domain-containing protein [Hymenobacter sp.]
MNNSIIQKITGYLLVISVGFLGLSACQEDEPEIQLAPGENLTALLAADQDLSIYTEVLDSLRLRSFLTSPGPFTVLAPNNAAFNDYFRRALQVNGIKDITLPVAGLTTAQLTTQTQKQLTLRVAITYTFIPKAFTAAEFPTPTALSLTSVPNKYINTSVQNGVIRLDNSATIITADIRGANGIIHKTDRVLTPRP